MPNNPVNGLLSFLSYNNDHVKISYELVFYVTVQLVYSASPKTWNHMVRK